MLSPAEPSLADAPAVLVPESPAESPSPPAAESPPALVVSLLSVLQAPASEPNSSPQVPSVSKVEK
jgi:hypothetical protein